MAKKIKTAESAAKTKESCVALYPWTLSQESRNKTVFNDIYVEHMSSVKTDSNPSQSTLTTIACGVLPNVTKELIEEFCERGVSMVVFDFDDLSHDQCQSMVDEIRQGVFNYSLNKNHRVPYSLALVLDLKGPRIMTGTVFNSKNNPSFIELPTNDNVYLTNDTDYKDKCTEDCIYVSSDSILRLNEKDRIYLDYGIELAVERVDPDQVYCVIKRGGFLGSQKVVHIPGIPIGVTALTKEDEKHVRTGVQLKIDAIMVPGVRNAAFFNCVKKFVIKEKGKAVDLFAKIDNSVGLENIDEIISTADGVCLHRQNLSMEIGHAKIIFAQKMILSKCNIIGKPVVTHGGFLNSMEFSTVPSSAEVNDVITTVLDGTDGIYLDVTTRSPHSVHCVQYASLLCRQGEAAVCDQQVFSQLNYKSKSKTDPAHAMCIGSVTISLKCNVAAIIAVTTNGQSAKTIASYRPKCPVLAVVRHGKCARKLSMWRNIFALLYIDPIDTDWSRDVENSTQFAMTFARKKGILNQGDLVLHMSCSKPNTGFVNTMNLFYVSAGDLIEA